MGLAHACPNNNNGMFIILQDIVQRATEVPTNSNDRPLLPVKIAHSDALPVDAPFEVEKAGVEL